MIILLEIIKYLFLFWLGMTVIYKAINGIIIFIYLIRDEIRIRKVYKNVDQTVVDFMSKIGRAILFVGKIGAGKTTQQALVTHFCTIDCYVQTREVVDRFKEEYIELDYTLLDVEIESVFKEYTKAMEEDPTIQYHFKNLFDVMADKYCDLLSEHSLNDGVTRKSFYDAFYQYIFAYCRIKNNHYVVANTKVYSYITNNYAYGFEGEMMSLKKMYEKKSLYFDEYMVIVKDENSLDPDDYYLNWQKTYKEDNGKAIFLRIIRHLFEGTVRFLTTDQDAVGMVANQRKIMDTFIYVMGMKIQCDRPTLTRLILNFKTFVKGMEQTWAKVFKRGRKRIDYLNNNNRFKKAVRWLSRLQGKVYSRALICYTDRIYRDAEDCQALRNNTESKRYYEEGKILGPIQWCYGSIDTYEFHYVYRWFQSQYGKNFWNLTEFKEIMTQAELDQKVGHMLKRKGSEEAKEEIEYEVN